MDVRDAVETDAEKLAALADIPVDAVRNVIHDRTVRVAEQRTNRGVGEQGDETSLVGFVSFEAQDGVVHVTQFGGPRDVCERLLSEPIRFAQSERMRVEVLVTADDDAMRAAVEAVGFEKKGSGPMFDGERTVRYRLTP